MNFLKKTRPYHFGFISFFILLVVSHQPANAGFLDDLKKQAEKAKQAIQAIKDVNDKVDGSRQKDEKKPNDETKPKDEKKPNDISHSLTGFIATRASVGRASSDIAGFGSNKHGSVYLSLYNTESSSGLAGKCNTYFLDQADNIRAPFLYKKAEEYGSLLLEKVRLDNVRESSVVKGRCFFEKLTHLGWNDYSSNTAEGVVLGKHVKTSMPTRSQQHLIDSSFLLGFGVENIMFTGNQLTCRDFFLYKKLNGNEVSLKKQGLIGSKLKFTNLRYGDVEGACLFDSYEILANKATVIAGKSPAVPVKVNDLNLGNITGFILRVSNESIKLRHRPCKHTFIPNSKDYLSGLSANIKKGMQVTLINVQKGRKCYFDKIILSTAPAAKNSPVASKPQKVNTNVPEVVSPAQETLAAQLAKGTFKPDPTKRSKFQGDLLIGMLIPDAELVSLQLTTLNGASSETVSSVEFSLSNMVSPTPGVYSCKRFIQEEPNMKYRWNKTTIDVLNKQALNKPRVLLSQVRSVDGGGTCRFVSYTILSDHDASAQLTRADVEKTTTAQQHEKDEIYKQCKSTLKLNRLYRCDCMAEKSLQERKLRPDGPLSLTHKQCFNIEKITDKAYVSCLNRSSRPHAIPKGSSATNFCGCYGERLEMELVEGNISNSQSRRALEARAKAYCKRKATGIR